MFETTKEFDAAVKNILDKLNTGASFSSLSADDDSLEAIAECINRGFLQEVACDRTAIGKPVFQ